MQPHARQGWTVGWPMLALAEADVGVAMGAGGSEAADIALTRDDLQSLVDTHALNRATLRIVHQNFWIATGSNLFGVVLGATGWLTPMTAGLLHIVHTLGVLANSSRLLHDGRGDRRQQKRSRPGVILAGRTRETAALVVSGGAFDCFLDFHNENHYHILSSQQYPSAGQARFRLRHF